jgi:hypothetical protein
MKLFYYDTKHQLVYASLDLNNLSVHDQKLIDKVLRFLDRTGITDGRYRNLVLANNIETHYDEGEPELVIT